MKDNHNHQVIEVTLKRITAKDNTNPLSEALFKAGFGSINNIKLHSYWIAVSKNTEEQIGQGISKEALIKLLNENGYKVIKILNDWN